VVAVIPITLSVQAFKIFRQSPQIILNARQVKKVNRIATRLQTCRNLENAETHENSLIQQKRRRRVYETYGKRSADDRGIARATLSVATSGCRSIVQQS